MTLTNITPEAHALHCHARSHRMPSDMETGPTAKPLKRCDARHALSRLRPKDRAMPLGLRMQSGKLNERLLGKGAALNLTPKLMLSATVLLFSRCADGLAATDRGYVQPRRLRCKWLFPMPPEAGRAGPEACELSWDGNCAKAGGRVSSQTAPRPRKTT